MKILIKFPTRSRPKIFRSTLDTYYRLLSQVHEVHFVVTMDQDDGAMNCPEIRSHLDGLPNLTYHYGQSKTKIEAINADMQGQEFDVLLLASDDMVPVVRGYDLVIAEQMAKHFPDLNGCLHFFDGRRRDLNTLTIMGRELYRHFGYIYHPDYFSVWCDNEYTDQTQAMGKAAFIDQMVIEHKWTDATGEDRLFERNHKYFKWDRSIYWLRRRLGFPQESVRTHREFLEDALRLQIR